MTEDTHRTPQLILNCIEKKCIENSWLHQLWGLNLNVCVCVCIWLVWQRVKDKLIKAFKAAGLSAARPTPPLKPLTLIQPHVPEHRGKTCTISESSTYWSPIRVKRGIHDNWNTQTHSNPVSFSSTINVSVDYQLCDGVNNSFNGSDIFPAFVRHTVDWCIVCIKFLN